MGLYGSGVLYGSGALYGHAVAPGSPLDLRRRIYGGTAPWLADGNPTPWRARQAVVGTLDADLAWLAPLAGLSTGSERQVTTRGNLLPEDVLSLQVADPTGRYLEDGADAALLAPGALLGLRWTVTTPAGSLTRFEQAYRVAQAPQRARDRWGREVLQTQADDWLRALLDRPVGSAVGLASGPEFVPLVTPGTPLRVATSVAVAWGGNWLDVVLGLYSTLAGGTVAPPTHASAAPGTRPGTPVPWATSSAENEDFEDWLGGGPWPTYGQVLESLQATFGWRARYGPDGGILVQDADTRVGAGYVVSTDPAVGGAFPVPWERYARTLQRAQYTRCEVWFAWLDDSHPPVPYLILAGSATSTSRLHPHTAPLGRTEFITSNVAIPTAIGGSWYETAAGVAERRLRDSLGKADQLALVVDSACPLPPPGDEVRVCVPADDVDGWYAFQSATVPLGVGPANWQLQWVRDA